MTESKSQTLRGRYLGGSRASAAGAGEEQVAGGEVGGEVGGEAVGIRGAVPGRTRLLP